MSAANVWKCFAHYRTDAARKFEKLFDNNMANILAALDDFPDKDAYNGHASKIGKTDQGENSGLETGLAEVHAHLLKKAKEFAEANREQPKAKGPDKAKMRSNQQIIEAFTKIITKYEEAAASSGKKVKPLALKAALDAKADEFALEGQVVDWPGTKNIWNEYARVHLAATGKKAT